MAYTDIDFEKLSPREVLLLLTHDMIALQKEVQSLRRDAELFQQSEIDAVEKSRSAWDAHLLKVESELKKELEEHKKDINNLRMFRGNAFAIMAFCSALFSAGIAILTVYLMMKG